jgi:hypothetical protein
MCLHDFTVFPEDHEIQVRSKAVFLTDRFCQYLQQFLVSDVDMTGLPDGIKDGLMYRLIDEEG